MQILLKQHNIEEALRDYVSKQGINLRGKEVSISFTSGRKNNGLTADINITEAEVQFPDIPDEEEEVTPTKPKLAAVPSDAPAVQAEADDEDIQQEEDAEADQVEEPATKTTTSLFGS